MSDPEIANNCRITLNKSYYLNRAGWSSRTSLTKPMLLRIEETGANSGAEINSVIVHTLSHTALQLSVASEGISEPQI
jgi:hypothetical protein